MESPSNNDYIYTKQPRAVFSKAELWFYQTLNGKSASCANSRSNGVPFSKITHAKEPRRLNAKHLYHLKLDALLTLMLVDFLAPLNTIDFFQFSRTEPDSNEGKLYFCGIKTEKGLTNKRGPMSPLQ